jgi:hypothetical protein
MGLSNQKKGLIECTIYRVLVAGFMAFCRYDTELYGSFFMIEVIWLALALSATLVGISM